MRVHYHELGAHLADTERSARRAERLGFDGYSSRELHSDPLFQLVLAAKATKQITLETRILLAFARSAMVVAYQAWFLQEYCGGRLRLGLGSTVKPLIEGRFASTWYPAARGMKEYIGALQSIWSSWESGEHPSWDGELFSIATHDDEFRPPPIEAPKPSIALAATGPMMCRVAGEFADAILLPILNSPRFYRERSIPAMQEGAKKAGRDPSTIQVTSSAIVYGAKNRDYMAEAKERARREVAFFICYSDVYVALLELHGWQEKHRYLRRRADEGTHIDDLVKEITDDMLDTFAVVAIGDEIGARLNDRYAGVLDEVVFAMRPVGLTLRDQDRVLAAAVEELHGGS